MLKDTPPQKKNPTTLQHLQIMRMSNLGFFHSWHLFERSTPPLRRFLFARKEPATPPETPLRRREPAPTSIPPPWAARAPKGCWKKPWIGSSGRSTRARLPETPGTLAPPSWVRPNCSPATQVSNRQGRPKEIPHTSAMDRPHDDLSQRGSTKALTHL